MLLSFISFLSVISFLYIIPRLWFFVPPSSTSSDSIPNYRYDVFISFRGLDTRNTFVDHLYAHLTRKGIFVFKDDTRLEKGESIPEQLLQAIQDSRVSIIVFSENYASSTWCLEEMAVIHDCKQRSNQIVFPVFYDVDPSHVRHQTGVYKSAFQLHTLKFENVFSKVDLSLMVTAVAISVGWLEFENLPPSMRYLCVIVMAYLTVWGHRNKSQHPSLVERWKRAMTDLANSVGYDLRNKSESEEIKNIVEAVIKKLNHKFSGFVDDLVGIQPRVQVLEDMLKLRSKDTDIRVLGIWGMGGIGKTTQAAALYDRISHKFEASCFIENVSRIYRDGGPISVQKQILRQTLDEKNLEMYSPFEISGIVWNRLRKIKVLIVLDNVGQLEQLQELVIEPRLLNNESRMIITTRDEHILKVYGAHVMHEVSLLNDNDARELVFRKAFKSEDQSSSCVELIPEVLKHAQGLPLAIRVIGSFLCTRDAIQWKAALDRFEKNQDNTIMDVLQTSVDELQYEEKEIFLHIACFFNEEREDYVKRILECCVLYPHIGIPRLIEKSLITLRDEKIHMHEMLQQLGKKIVRNQFPDDPGSWSRIWLGEDFFRLLTTKKGADEVKAIVLNKNEDISKCNVHEFSKLENLTLLILYHKSFSGRLNFLSRQLQYLLWHDYPFASLPSSFEANYLVELNMPNSSINHVWKGNKSFPCLKRMDLSNSKSLIKTPDFSAVPNLERLDLSGCANLSELHPSIGYLHKLAFLSFRNCSNLVSINFGTESTLCSLRVLHLSGCTKLENTPDFTGAINLEYLEIDGCTSLSSVHDSIGALAKLTFLSLRGCKNLVSIPDSINTMISLQTLDLCGCLQLTYLPVGTPIRNSSSHLGALIVLDVSFCSLLELPDAIRELRCLERLHLEGNHFVSLPDTIQHLQCLAYLNLSHCHELELFPNIPSISASTVGKYFKKVSGSRDHRSGLYLFDCPKLPNMNDFRTSWRLADLWLQRLIEKPAHFRCGFDIVVPWDDDIIPSWFLNRGFSRTLVIKRIRIEQFSGNDNWIGFSFGVVFKVNNRPMVSSRRPSSSHRFYLSFESECTEEYFDLPLDVDLNKNKIDEHRYLWMIYISREHCHFVKTEAQITFKANHAGIEISEWGMRCMFREDIDDMRMFGGLAPGRTSQRYVLFDSVKERNSGGFSVVKLRNSGGTKIQLPYNWLVTEEDQDEKDAAKAKENRLSIVGL